MKTKDDKDNPEWTPDDIASAGTFADLPPELGHKLRSRARGPQQPASKALMSVRLSQEVLEFFQSGGSGWQSRMNKVLQDYVRQQSKP